MNETLVIEEAGTELIPGEKQVWAHEQVGQLAPYGVQVLLLRADLRWPYSQVRQAAQAAVEAHPVFSARLHRLAGGVIRRSEHERDRIGVVERPAKGIEAALAEMDFDVDGGSGAFACVATGDKGHFFGVALHPVFGDAGVLNAVAQDFSRALTGERTSAAATVAMMGDVNRDRLPFWRERLDDLSCAVARLPHRFGGSEDIVRGGAEHVLAPTLAQALNREGTDAEAHCAAALGIVLSRYSGHEDLRFAVGSVHAEAERRSEDILPLRLRIAPGNSAKMVLEQAQRELANGRAQKLPSELLVQDVLRREGADRHPLGAITLHVRRDMPLPGGLNACALPDPASQGELMLLVRLCGDGSILLRASYARDLFEPALVARFLVHLERVLEAGLEDPARATGRIALLTGAELDRLSAPYEDREANAARAVHELIAEHARLTPDKTALIWGGAEWSHGRLNRRANRLAHRLRALGVGAEVPVAVIVERGHEAVMAILAVLKAGGAYIPVEPDHPQSRNHHILSDAGVQVVITRRCHLDKLPKALAAQILCLDDNPGAGQPETDPDVPIHRDQLAYIMYTSGSTGKPKGVAVEHGPLSDHLQDTARVYEMTSESRELPFLPFSSDGGHERWMNPLMMGGSAVIPDGVLWTPEQSFAAMRRHGCNNASIPTTYLQQLAEWAEQTGEAPDMRLYSFGGEGLAQATFDLLSRELRAPMLINGYGPTETIMTPMVWKVRAGTKFEGAYAPLGRAVGHRRAYVLDRQLMPCPIGVVGEIHLGGEGVARGYVNRPGTTADRFIPDPFAPELDGRSGARMYRSGDLGRWREDGTIEFLGRVDHQVKLNGYRIEPGEIEAALLQQPGVSEALVLLRENCGEKQLIGYVVAPQEVQEQQLMRALEAQLPRHMMPSAVVVLEKMPTNPNAKLDRAALPLPGARCHSGKGAPPAGQAEEAVLAIWQEEIGNPNMGVTDDFFDMGGRSLTALKVLARMRKVWPSTALTIADLFDVPTVRALVRRIEAGDATGRQAIALRGTGSQPMLYCFPGLLVSTREYLRLTTYLGDDQPVTGFLCHSLNEEKHLNVAVQDVVTPYVEHIRRESSGKACAFLGWSWGGLLAWEAARQLKDEVDLRMVGMVDVCDLGSDFALGAVPRFAPGEREQLEAELRAWLGKTRMRAQWDALIGSMDKLCYDQFLRFIGNEAEPLPYDGPEVSSREHTFWVLIDNALVFRRYELAPLDVPVTSFSAGDTLSRGLNLKDWRQVSPRAEPAEVVPGTNHLHIIGDRLFHGRFKAALERAFAEL